LQDNHCRPGGNIFSTWPKTAFMVQSDTSMAAPYIAVIAALYISAFGGPRQASARLRRRVPSD
jgi:subtilisin family serine protease